MKTIVLLFFSIALLTSCNNNPAETTKVVEDTLISGSEIDVEDEEVSETDEEQKEKLVEMQEESIDEVTGNETAEELLTPSLEEEQKETEPTREEPKTEPAPKPAVESKVAPPTYNKLPEDAIFEALIVAKNGTTLFEQPNSSAKKVDSLQYGDLTWVIGEHSNWTYLYTLGKEGWVSNSAIRKIPYNSAEKTVVSNPNDLLVLVNKKYKLPSNYRPDDLSLVNIPFPFEGKPESKYLREEAARALEEMVTKAKEDGIELFGVSGYRSFSRQQTIFTNNLSRSGFIKANTYSAFPGESEHQTGLTMDVSAKSVKYSLTESFATTAEGIWVANHAHEYGFIIRYPKGKEHITGYIFEPWHLRYVGKDPAKAIFEANITLEEYLGK